MKNTGSTPEIKVAKINRNSAIIVVVITAVAGLVSTVAAGWLSTSGKCQVNPTIVNTAKEAVEDFKEAMIKLAEAEPIAFALFFGDDFTTEERDGVLASARGEIESYYNYADAVQSIKVDLQGDNLNVLLNVGQDLLEELTAENIAELNEALQQMLPLGETLKTFVRPEYILDLRGIDRSLGNKLIQSSARLRDRLTELDSLCERV